MVEARLAPPFGVLWRRVREASLGAKLVFFSTLVTTVAVLAAFAVLSLSINRHNRHWIAGALARHQEALSSLELGKLGDLVRTSTLMTDSPTLRAAIETFAHEAGPSFERRPDLLSTIQHEADRVSTALGRDLLIVTDRHGVVLAASGEHRELARVGEDLGVHLLVRHALEQDGPVGPENFAVLERGGLHFRVGSVPIAFESSIIGTLTLGDRIDASFARRLARSFDCEVAILDGERLVASTVTSDLDRAALATLAAASRASAELPPVVELVGEEYVVASRSLGRESGGGEVEAYLLSSLGRHAGEANRYLLWILLAGGAWSLLVVGSASWWVSRSLLRPLDRFVGFMRSVAVAGDHGRRFDGPLQSVEVQTLNDAYDRLVDSLLEHERRMLQNARDELGRLERLKESEKLAALGRTLSGAAHEINNPLTGVLGNVELLLREVPSAGTAHARLERIKREGERIAMLVRNILKISHRDTGELSELDLRQVLRETVEIRHHDFASAGLVIDLDLGPTALRTLGNELELHQVFLNLINNAYDALKEPGARGHLRIRAAEERGSTVIRIADDGPGMREPHRVFDHFYTTKPVGRGTGLGLGICRAIVQRHGGRIRAENLAEGGACFTVELPLAAGRVISACEPLVPALEPPCQGQLEASVLLVDDEPTIVELQREILESLGAEVVAVGSGAEAIEHLRERDFDIIVSDFKMPGSVSGRDLLRWIEAHRPAAAHNFVFVTGDTAGEDGRSLAEGLGVQCLMKPFSMAEYALTMREIHAGRARPKPEGPRPSRARRWAAG